MLKLIENHSTFSLLPQHQKLAEVRSTGSKIYPGDTYHIWYNTLKAVPNRILNGYELLIFYIGRTVATKPQTRNWKTKKDINFKCPT